MNTTDPWATDAEITDDPQEGARLLAAILDRAARHGRGAILFAVYRAESTRAQAEQFLLAELRKHDLRVRRVRLPLDDAHSGPQDLPLWLKWHPPAADQVIMVYDLARAFPGVLNALNYRRELFVEGRWKTLFWLRDDELGQVGRRAPDFWAFRNQVLEFLDVPPPERAARLSQKMDLAWLGFDRRLPPQEREARIGSRERLLAELGDAPETAAARADLLYTLGWLYWWKKDHARALESFQQALALARQLENEWLQSAIHHGLGAVYSDLGRHEEAIAAYRRAVELDPDDAYPHNGLGNVYSDLGRHDEAMAEYHRAIELDPGYASPHNNLGNVYDDLGRREEAIEAYRRAIELDPDFAAPHNGLGNVYRDLGRREEAIESYRRAIELDPDLAAPHTALGALYETQGRLEDALREHRRAVELQPENGVRHASLASVLRKLGRAEEAEKHLAQARRLMTPDEHYNLACLESIAGNVEAALEHLAQALEQAPSERAWAARDPDLAWIRDDSRFQALVERGS